MSDMSSRNELYENERRELEEKKEDSSSRRRAGENSTTMRRFAEYKVLDENLILSDAVHHDEPIQASLDTCLFT